MTDQVDKVYRHSKTIHLERTLDELHDLLDNPKIVGSQLHNLTNEILTRQQEYHDVTGKYYHAKRKREMK
jgi:hypothetical protein